MSTAVAAAVGVATLSVTCGNTLGVFDSTSCGKNTVLCEGVVRPKKVKKALQEKIAELKREAPEGGIDVPMGIEVVEKKNGALAITIVNVPSSCVDIVASSSAARSLRELSHITQSSILTFKKPSNEVSFEVECHGSDDISACVDKLSELLHNLAKTNEAMQAREMSQKKRDKAAAERTLEELGATMYHHAGNLDWSELAGYDEVKQEVEETVLLALKHPQLFDEVARSTRKRYESNRPKAILFEGPPGTGKTSTARIIASKATVPLVYLPIESIMSKYYGESEKKLGEAFDACKTLNAIIFLDEIDAIATARDSDMHEASRRVLSVLLRKVDGYDTSDATLLIGATNRKGDLDAALLNRFDLSIRFGLPDLKTRKEIFRAYAQHLSEDELMQLAKVTEGTSGRSIKDICETAERKWASELVRRGDWDQTRSRPKPPSLKHYKMAAVGKAEDQHSSGEFSV